MARWWCKKRLVKQKLHDQYVEFEEIVGSVSERIGSESEWLINFIACCQSGN